MTETYTAQTKRYHRMLDDFLGNTSKKKYIEGLEKQLQKRRAKGIHARKNYRGKVTMKRMVVGKGE